MSRLTQAARLWRTLRYLKPGQITGRLAYRLRRPKPDLSPPPPCRKPAGVWPEPVAWRPSMTGPEEVVFLNVAARLSDCGWDDPARSKLWRYNLHYFDDLNATGGAERRDWHTALIARWIAENPPGQGSGWEPYPTSLRIVNWVTYSQTGGTLSKDAIHSLAIQARWLMQRLEWHILGNHLFVNAKALLAAGSFFDGPEADVWRAQALSILKPELTEQLLPDGGQFELSPMYHALMVADLLDMVAIGQVWPVAEATDMAARARARLPGALLWMDTMTHPDGGISFFNDAAHGIAPTPDALWAYAARLGLDLPDRAAQVRARYLPDSGYLRLEQGRACVLADLARIGPDYLPGHAHADTLSLELSLGRQRLIVNGGTSVYGTDAERHRQRSTPAHATVTVMGQNSSEVWSGFRVGRRARPTVTHVTPAGPRQGFVASHDGYRHLPGAPRHQRSVTLTDSSLRVVDHVSGGATAEARFPLHPDVTLAPDGRHLICPDGWSVRVTASEGLRHEPTTYHPEFGVSVPSTCLVLPLHDGQADLTLTWEATPD